MTTKEALEQALRAEVKTPWWVYGLGGLGIGIFVGTLMQRSSKRSKGRKR